MMWIKSVTVVVVAVLYLKLNRDEQFNSDDIVGKNVLVTGASGGIGEQIAYHYAGMGANVFITARREKNLIKVVEKCRALGKKDAKFGYAVADMEMYEVTAPNVILDAVNNLGGLDHVILNHAILNDFAPFKGQEEDLRLFEKTIDINLNSYVYLASYAMPHLRKSNFGRLGVVSSLGGKLDVPYMSQYSSSKFGLDGFFSAIRQEFQSHDENISVTLCLLGVISTDRGKSIFTNFEDSFNIDTEKMLEFNTIIDPESTALEIIKSTSLGHRELYYPPILGSRYIPQLLPAFRHLFPKLLELDINLFKKSIT